MDASDGSGSNSHVWPIVDDNGAVDINGMMDNLEERIENLEMVFAYLKNKKMLERQENKPKKDSRLNSKKSTMDHSFGSAEDVDHVRILQSCNGLLLCSGSAWHVFYYIYNPSTILFKRLPQPNYYLRDDSWFFINGLFRLAFDPRKSSHYKVVQAGGKAGKIFESCGCLLLVCRDDIGSTTFTIYEMMKGSFVWSVSSVFRLAFDPRESSHYKVVQVGGEAEGLNRELKHCKLNMKDHDYPIMTSLEIAHGLHRGRNLLESFGGPINDPILLLMELPHMLHLEGKFFESFRYLVNIVQLLNLLLRGWSIRTGVWSICLGEGEEDAFVVINLFEKVVKYNLISNTNTEIFDIRSNQVDDDDDDDDDDAVLFIPPF
nr:hypothetical protein [Tanacetum cinerariifolium]